MQLEDNEDKGILAKKVKPILKEELPPQDDINPPKKTRGRPKKVLSNEEIEFKKQVQEETEKAYKEVLESRAKQDLKKKLRKEALENGIKFKDPETTKPKRALSEKQLLNLAKGREKAIEKQKEKGAISKKINEDVKVIQQAKKNIRKTLIVDKIKEQIDGLDSESEEEIVIQKKPKKKVIQKEEEEEEQPTPVYRPLQPPKPIITFY
jgi:hypothetical protein